MVDAVWTIQSNPLIAFPGKLGSIILVLVQQLIPLASFSYLWQPYMALASRRLGDNQKRKGKRAYQGRSYG